MAKISASQAAAMFEEIIGWPYDSPGTNDQRGIDCSGAWVRVYRKFGLKIDHSSNSQYRRFCTRTGTIVGLSDLRIGMAVFKAREWKADRAANRNYGTPPGDVYHVGCVASVNPLRIVHATPNFAKVDTKIGQWAYWGMLGGVDYSDNGVPESGIPPTTLSPQSPAAQIKPEAGQAKVITTTTGLKLRKLPGKGGAVIKEMPIGTIVQVLRVEGVWAYVRWNVKPGLHHIGWCAAREGETEYLQFG